MGTEVIRVGAAAAVVNNEANVERFTKLLRELTDDTQFIMITHNRKSMEAANLLYGVTMEEPGVSKLVSVRFS